MKTLPAQTLPTKLPSNPNLKPAPPSFLHHGSFSNLPLQPLNLEQPLLICFWISIQTLSLCYPPLVSFPHDFKIHGVERSRSSRNRGRLLQDLASNRNLKTNPSSKPQTRWSLQFCRPFPEELSRRWTSFSQEGRSWPLGTFPGDVATTGDRFERQDPVAFPECVADKVFHGFAASTEGFLEVGRRSFESWDRFGSTSLYRSGALRGLRVLALVDSPPRPCVGAFVARLWDPRLWFSDPLFGNPFAEIFYLLYASNLHLAWIRGTRLVYFEVSKYEQHNDLALQSERLSPGFLNTLCYDNLMIHCFYDNDPLNHDLNPLLSVDPLKFLTMTLCAIVLDGIALTVIAFDMNYKLYFPDSTKLETEQSDLNLLCVGAFSAKCFKDPDIDMSVVFPWCRRVSIILFSEPLTPQPDNFLFHSYDYLHPKLMAFRKFNPIENLPLVLDHLTHFPNKILPMTNDIMLSNTSTNNDSSQSLCYMETLDMTFESKNAIRNHCLNSPIWILLWCFGFRIIFFAGCISDLCDRNHLLGRSLTQENRNYNPKKTNNDTPNRSSKVNNSATRGNFWECWHSGEDGDPWVCLAWCSVEFGQVDLTPWLAGLQTLLSTHYHEYAYSTCSCNSKIEPMHDSEFNPRIFVKLFLFECCPIWRACVKTWFAEHMFFLMYVWFLLNRNPYTNQLCGYRVDLVPFMQNRNPNTCLEILSSFQSGAVEES